MLLAADGGATKTHFLLANNNGERISEFFCGPLNLVSTTKRDLIQDLKKTFRSKIPSFTKIDKAVFGIAGVDTAKEEDFYQNLIYANFRKLFLTPPEIVNDAEIALTANTDNLNSIVIIAGTGSNCFGKNSSGNIAKTGGLDYFLSDEGSGYAIGQDVFRAAVRSADGRGEKTILEDLVLAKYQIDSISDLKNIVYSKDFNKDEVAELSFILEEGLNKNDHVSKVILENNIGQLLIMLRPVIANLNLNQTDFDLVLSGSLFTKQLIKFDHFQGLVLREYPQANLILAKNAPVYGALKMLVSSS